MVSFKNFKTAIRDAWYIVPLIGAILFHLAVIAALIAWAICHPLSFFITLGIVILVFFLVVYMVLHPISQP